jgi:uncharacterized UBP type Zn finger protein
VQTIVSDLCQMSKVDVTRGRLWYLLNYHPSSSTADANNNNQIGKTGNFHENVDSGNNGYFVLPSELTLGKTHIQEGQYLLFELCHEDGNWPRTNGPLSSSNISGNIAGNNSSSLKNIYGGSSSDNNNHGGSSTSISDLKLNDGRIGLDNLGNTCYMNSSLQALLHTDLLTEYFLRDYHLRDINTDSKFGHKGWCSCIF